MKILLKKMGVLLAFILIGLSIVNLAPSVASAAPTDVTWTNGSLEAKLPDGRSGYKATIGKTTGKWYWEITVKDSASPTASYGLIGIVGETSSTNLDTWPRIAYFGNTGQIYAPGYVSGSGVYENYATPFKDNDIIGIALDLDNDTITWYKNGESQGIGPVKPSVLPGTEVTPIVQNATIYSSRTLIANFGASEFEYPIPEGHLPYNESESSSPTDPTDPTDPQPSSDRAILTITMLTGLEKEFDLSMSEVDAFIIWYDTKDAGSGPSKYAINKHDNNRGPFSKRTDYVIFNNILTFEVSEYSTVTTATYQ